MTTLGPNGWADFLHRSRPQTDWTEVSSVLCLDPGETTGWALFEEGELAACGQWDTPEPEDLAQQIALVKVNEERLDTIVYEEYRVRGNKFKEHVGSEVVTIQHVGAIKVTADLFDIELHKQGAGLAKNFTTDAKLRHWGLYQPNLRHANDAIRHGVYFLLFASNRRGPHGPV